MTSDPQRPAPEEAQRDERPASNGGTRAARNTGTPPPDDLFHLMVEGVRDYAIFLLDPEGHIRTWNTGAHRIKQYEADEIIGHHFSIFYPPSDVRADKPGYELRVATEVGRFEDEGWRIRKDGTPFWANVVITAVRDRSGNLVGFGKVTRDLTERKHAEDEREILLTAERASRVEAETARARLEAIQSITEAGLIHLDLEQLLESLLTRVGDLLLCDAVWLMLREDDRLVRSAAVGASVDTSVETSVQMGEGFTGRVGQTAAPAVVDESAVAQFAPGEQALTEMTSLLAVPLKIDEQVIGVVTVGNRRFRRYRADDQTLLTIAADRMALAIDHARAVEAEQRARGESLAAQESARLRDEFMAIAAHELKTPLTGLRAAAQLAFRVLKREPADLEASRSLLDQVVAQADRLNRLVRQLLEASRLDGGRFSIDAEDADVTGIVSDVVRQFRLTTGRPIGVDAPDRLVATIDALRFEQVVVNLLDNALKYSPTDQPVEVRLQATEAGFELSVRDFGEGVDPSLSEQVFERFTRGSGGSSSSGLGVGLYVSREIVRAHGGEISVEQAPDRGARFVVTMPLAPSVPVERPAARS